MTGCRLKAADDIRESVCYSLQPADCSLDGTKLRAGMQN
jgi:hypothetical protein